jgi:hypothetical protein
MARVGYFFALTSFILGQTIRDVTFPLKHSVLNQSFEDILHYGYPKMEMVYNGFNMLL